MIIDIRPPRERIKSIIQSKQRTYDVTRIDDAPDDAGYREETKISTTWTAWLYDPRESRSQTDFGQRKSGDLSGLALPDQDIQHGDRVTYGLQSYEVDDLVPVLDGETNDYYRISLVRRESDN